MNREQIVYHGTSKQKLAQIAIEGVNPPSYWGDLDEAITFANGYGDDGVVISTELFNHDCKANMELYKHVVEDDCPVVLSQPPLQEDELIRSLELVGSVVCNDRVFNYDIVGHAPNYTAET